MDVLEKSIGFVQSVPESAWTKTIFLAADQCARLGSELAYRQEKLDGSRSTRRRIAFVLAPWDKLRAMYADFRNSVDLMHTLTQNLMWQTLADQQRELLDFVRIQADFNTLIKARLDHRGAGLFGRRSSDQESTYSRASSFTVGGESLADVVTLADEVVAKSIARGFRFDNDATLVLGTITVTHEDKARFVPVRAKYDTGSDVNFIPSSLVEKHGLGALLQELDEEEKQDNVFIGLNEQEYHVQHIIVLQWCASSMHHVRTTKFHVADEVPFDMLLGNPFIQENRIFDPQRTALAIRRKRPSAAQRAEEDRKAQENETSAAEESQRSRNEYARKHALEKEAKRLAKAQTSASSMMSTFSDGTSVAGTAPTINSSEMSTTGIPRPAEAGLPDPAPTQSKASSSARLGAEGPEED